MLSYLADTTLGNENRWLVRGSPKSAEAGSSGLSYRGPLAIVSSRAFSKKQLEVCDTAVSN